MAVVSTRSIFEATREREAAVLRALVRLVDRLESASGGGLLLKLC
jgi:hypothetical protein